METLKREILELLDKDVEFRYAVAGYLGLSEIMKKLDALVEEQIRLREEQTKIWKEITKLWEGQNKLWEEVKLLRANYERMRKYMLSGFRELSASIGVAFEDHAAAFLDVLLEEMGYPDARVGRKILAYEGEAVEINLFCEKPLLVGEATVNVKSTEEAEREIRKLLERVKIIEEKYGRKPEMIVLSVARATEEAMKTLKNLTEKHGVKLILGKEIEETLAI
jgi:hypothetical protein